MKQRTPMIKGSIISIGLLIGGSAMATPMTNDAWHVYHDAYPRYAAEGHETPYNEHRREKILAVAPLKNSGSVISVADISGFSKADIATAIAAFYSSIFGNQNSPAAPSTHLPVSADPVDQMSIADSNRSEVLYPSAAQPSTSVPEPASLAIFGLGLAGMGFTTRARRKVKK